MKPLRIFALLFLCLAGTDSFGQVPHPQDEFGFMPGDDYKLARYDQMESYFRSLADASDRVILREIGTSVLGEPLLLLIISSEENLASLDRWQEISTSLARARIAEEEATALSKEGRAVVWIDGGLHATEVAGAQMTPLLAWRVATEESAEMAHIRDNVILLLMPVMNPDGLDIIASWYDLTVNTPYEATRPPWLYHYYVGHDNNRDWFMNNMPESKAVTEVLYNEWYPQIVYNHHQTSPSWTRIFLPPFTDPVNPRIHPGVTTAVNLVGSAMANRFAMKDMPGVISGVTFSMWWNGGMRTVPYFHNMVGILTEVGHATPSPRFFDPDSIPSYVSGRNPTTGTNIFYPNPWKGGWSHFADPVHYMITGSMAVLRLAADRRESWLYNIWQMGRDAITKTDSVAAYVIPSDQWNAGEELKLVNLLRVGGIEIEYTTHAFSVGDTAYAPGSFIIPKAQAFRPYLEDLLEAQHYPDRRSQSGAPIVPYDLAGWTLPLQMGVKVDRVNKIPVVETVPVNVDLTSPPGTIADGRSRNYVVDPRENRSRHAVNKALSAGLTVQVVTDSIAVGDHIWPAGAFFVESDEDLYSIAELTGVSFHSVPEHVPALHELRTPRIGLYKSWVANMDEGWTRWLLESYAFDVDTLHDADIQAIDLSAYTAILLPSQGGESLLHGHRTGMMPEAYTGGLGLDGTLALKQYVENGGTLVALDAASDFVIDHFGLPVENVVDGVSGSSFFIPGSLVRIGVDTSHPIGFGMRPEAAASFVRSRAFSTVRRSTRQEGGRITLAPGPDPPVEVVASYAEEDLLMSGWALGEEEYLGGKAAIVRVGVGDGNVILFGFRPQFRGQSRGTYKLLFNALTLGDLHANRQ
ncbi:MAG: M14 family metallopeptidase [Bacteroidetes bacterium]|nr:M14 family metallopeptidase [Bacteroidota bacterium]MDE2672343.1 M14 family metallopeptidase [Bacteroidota bacterium]